MLVDIECRSLHSRLPPCVPVLKLSLYPLLQSGPPITVDAGDGDNVIYRVDPSGTADGPQDVLTGIGNDWVQTGAGNDRLDLGTHADGSDSFDIAFGQGGSDTFVLNIGSGYLTVGDFVQDEDVLEIRGITFNDLGSSIDTARNSMWVWDNISGDVLAELQGFTGTLMATDVAIA